MTDHLTPEDARRLLEGSTPGPWEPADHGADEFWIGNGYTAIEHGDPDEYGDHGAVAVGSMTEADAALIAAAPALAAALAEHEGCDEAKAKVGELQGILIDNTHALRTVLHGHSTATGETPKAAWERTLAEATALRTERDEARTLLAEARTEINRWGYGDHHYGPTPRDPDVLATVAKIDAFLARTAAPEPQP